MDYKTINVNNLIYKRGYKNNINVLYKGNKLTFTTPLLECKSKIIEEGKNKYYILLDLNKCTSFYNFLSQIEIVLKQINVNEIIHSSDKDEINFINYLKRSKILKIKVPCRYNKFEIDVYNSDNDIITTSNIKENTFLSCDIELKNIWVYNNLYGCLWILKKVNISDISSLE